jgi:hypothetical protein
MGFVVFLLVVVVAGGGWLMWCWHEELKARLLGQHQRVRLAEQELAGLRRALRMELAGRWHQRLMDEIRRGRVASGHYVTGVSMSWAGRGIHNGRSARLVQEGRSE